MENVIRPKIGVGVWIRKDNKVLLGLRSKSRDSGLWCPPGGHLEMNETLEEASVKIGSLRFVQFTEDIMREHSTHYITFYFAAEWESGTPVPQEEEFSKLDWFDFDALPQPLFRPTQQFVALGINPFA